MAKREFNFYANCPKCECNTNCEAISSIYVYATGQTISVYVCKEGHKFSTKSQIKKAT